MLKDGSLTFRLTRVIYILFGILEALLGLRFIFKLNWR